MPRHPTVTFRLPEEVLEQLELLAATEQRSVSNLIRLIVTQYLDRSPLVATQSKLTGPSTPARLTPEDSCQGLAREFAGHAEPPDR